MPNKNVMLTTQELVRYAAKMLDRCVPGWHTRVDVETLQMSDCCNCTLGQVFGPKMEGFLWRLTSPNVRASIRRHHIRNGFGRGMHKLRIDYIRHAGAFSGDPNLRCHWIEEIAERRANEG